jgi:recombination protein RecA
MILDDNKKKALDLAIKQIDKTFGKGSLIRLGDKVVEPIEFISTGSIGLDLALGIGGLPKGRVVEIYGPESSGKTTLTLHAIAEAQREGGLCAFIDAEHALDVAYAKRLGVDTDNLLVSQPDNGEMGLEILETLIRSTAFSLIVVDSVAALTPKVEIDGDMDDQQVGVQARLMSKALRKITGILNKTNSTVIFINQIRMKIGMTGYGCFHYDTLINFTDGRSIPIGEVVDKRIEGKVYCINEETSQIEEKNIIDWHDNGKITNKNDFIHFETNSIDSSYGGKYGFTCTPNHEILTNAGWKKAENINKEDLLISKYKETINGSLKDFLTGIFIGDSYIFIRNKNTGSLKLRDNKNNDYVNWKISKLNKFFKFSKKIRKNNFEEYLSEFNYEFSKVKKEFKNRDINYFINNFSIMGFAVLFMDDGFFDNSNFHNRMSISLKRFKKDFNKLNKFSNFLIDYFKLEKKDIRFNKDGTIVFSSKATKIIQNSIKEFIPECMQYKLAKEYRGFYNDFELTNTPVFKTDTVIIKSISICSDRMFRNKRKFDISVEDNHNYMVGGVRNGVIVHNSPETTTGGNALKFYSSVRLDIRRISTLKQGENSIGNRVKVKVVKNKVAPPFKQAEFDIMFGKGISKSGEIVDYGVKYDIIDKAGAWFSYGDKKLGQGKEKAKEVIEADRDLMLELEEKVKLSLTPDEFISSSEEVDLD